MPARSYAQARALLPQIPFRNDLERRECEQLLERREADVTREVRAAAQDEITEVDSQVEKLAGRYTDYDKEAESLRRDMASGRLTAKEAGRRNDQLRRELEGLDPLIDSLISMHASAQVKYNEPIAYRDEMHARFPVLGAPDWPW